MLSSDCHTASTVTQGELCQQ